MMDRGLSETCRVLFKNTFDKLVNLVGFIVRIYHDERSPERQSRKWPFMYNLDGRYPYTISFACRAAG